MVHLVEINAQFVHSNLALRYYRSQFIKANVSFKHHHFTINQPFQSIYAKLLEDIIEQESIILCSCYLWNIEKFLHLAEVLRTVLPKSKIIFGGPEIADIDNAFLLQYDAIDHFLIGEGENYIAKMIAYIKANKIEEFFNPSVKLIELPAMKNLDKLGFGYDVSELSRFKIAYYEASRGCPYHCAYCTSANENGVRYKSLDVVKKELKIFFDANVEIIKFIDRTFNAPVQRSINIIKYIETIDNGKTTCHFELSPNLINDALLSTLKDLRKGLVQVEIGIQSTYSKTLAAIDRQFDSDELKRVAKLCHYDNCHVHLDLIAGLPYEDLSHFKKSYHAIIALNPDVLQVGMLKLLKGTPLTSKIDTFDYKYDRKPPYEFFCNRFLSVKDKLELIALEEGTSHIYNDDLYKQTNAFLCRFCKTPYEVYSTLGKQMLSFKSAGFQVGKNQIAELIIDFAERDLKLPTAWIKSVLGIDYLLAEQKLPKVLASLRVSLKGAWHKKLLQHEHSLPQAYRHFNSRQLIKHIAAIKVTYHYMCFKQYDQPRIILKYKDSKALHIFTEDFFN